MKNDKICGGETGDNSDDDEGDNLDQVKRKIDTKTGPKECRQCLFMTPEYRLNYPNHNQA